MVGGRGIMCSLFVFLVSISFFLLLRVHYGPAEPAVIVGGRTECTVSKLIGELNEACWSTPSCSKLTFFMFSPCEGQPRTFEILGALRRQELCSFSSPTTIPCAMAFKLSRNVVAVPLSNLHSASSQFSQKLERGAGQTGEMEQIHIKNNRCGIREVKVFCRRVGQIKPPLNNRAKFWIWPWVRGQKRRCMWILNSPGVRTVLYCEATQGRRSNLIFWWDQYWSHECCVD